MQSKRFWPIKTELGNTWTHLVGVIFALSSIWLVWLAADVSWQMAFGVICFIVGMFFMFLSSTAYHWVREGKTKDVLRKFDHISIYVMIACSYTPILIGVVGGWLGWTVFAFQWLVVIGGIFYKIYAIGRWPRLSLAIYLIMGWSIVLIAKPVVKALMPETLWLLLAEGIAYTAGTYFFAHDERPHYHAIWHVFVLLGALAHWGAVLTLLL
ncbi:MAG: hemolysin III family protein [Bacteroidaceae bacterium]|nr:hemolysin III family protein [Bacteroidaceae bacterium]